MPTSQSPAKSHKRPIRRGDGQGRIVPVPVGFGDLRLTYSTSDEAWAIREISGKVDLLSLTLPENGARLSVCYICGMRPTQSWHMDYLDSLRGIAVLGVLMVHASITASGRFLDLHTPLQWITFSGQRGVALFFVVSAFTLFLSLDNRRDERQTYRNFFLRRWFRLAPMFYVAMVITRLFNPKYAGTPGQNIATVFFLHGLSPAAIGYSVAGGWSVADEALFYLCLPFLFSRIRTLKSSLVWAIAGSCIGFIFQVALTLRFPNQADYFQLFSITAEFPVFLQGICAYFIWKERIRGIESARRRKLTSALLLLAAAVLYALLLPFSNWKLYPSTVVCVLLLLGLSAFPWALIVNKVTRFLGKISYSIYLLHFTVNLWLQNRVAELLVTHPEWNKPHAELIANFTILLLVTVPFAAAAWRWIEEPGIAAGRKVITHLSARSTGYSAVPAELV